MLFLKKMLTCFSNAVNSFSSKAQRRAKKHTYIHQMKTSKTGYIAKQQDNGKYVVGRNCEKFQNQRAKQFDTIDQAEKAAIKRAKDLAAKSESLNGIPCLIANLGAVDGDYLQAVLDALKPSFDGVTVLAGSANSAVALASSVSPTHTSKLQAGKIIQTIAPIVGGKGGGKPDSARGGGKDTSKISEALAAAKNMLAAM
jgi:alanyl-tRNA synthetase